MRGERYAGKNRRTFVSLREQGIKFERLGFV